MDFQAFRAKIARMQSVRWTARQKRLNALRRALRGKLYSHIDSAFSEERTNGFSGDIALLDDRRASVQDALPIQLVRDLQGMLFGEAHRPTFAPRKAEKDADGKPVSDDDTARWINAFIHDVGLWLIAMKTVYEGSVGSCATVLRVLGKNEKDAEGGFTPVGKGAYHAEVWPGEQCKPVFHRTAPSELASLERVWFVGEDALLADGYKTAVLEAEAKASGRGPQPRTVSNMSAQYGAQWRTEWVLRVVLTPKGEEWYLPVPRWRYERADWIDSMWRPDGDRSSTHDMDEVTARWLRPLPFDDDDLFPDGLSLFEPAIDFQFRIDRTLSQVGRAFDYAGDPQLARIFDKTTGGGAAFGQGFEEDLAVGGTASDVLEQAGGEIKFVEISADGLKIAIETYVKMLRDVARENAAMSRITPDGNARTELSAVAMKMLNFAQTVVADILRISMVENEGVIPLLRLAMRMALKVDVALPSLDGDVKPNPDAKIETSWPEYYELHGQDKLYDVQATTAAVTGGLISQEAGVEYTGGQFDIQNTSAELKKIEAEKTQKEADEVANTQATTEATESIKAKYAPTPATQGATS